MSDDEKDKSKKISRIVIKSSEGFKKLTPVEEKENFITQKFTHQIVIGNILGPTCQLLFHGDEALIFNVRGKRPNWFWRINQYLFFGFKWRNIQK